MHACIISEHKIGQNYSILSIMIIYTCQNKRVSLKKAAIIMALSCQAYLNSLLLSYLSANVCPCKDAVPGIHIDTASTCNTVVTNTFSVHSKHISWKTPDNHACILCLQNLIALLFMIPLQPSPLGFQHIRILDIAAPSILEQNLELYKINSN